MKATILREEIKDFKTPPEAVTIHGITYELIKLREENTKEIEYYYITSEFQERIRGIDNRINYLSDMLSGYRNMSFWRRFKFLLFNK